jgi:hypothetical protein
MFSSQVSGLPLFGIAPDLDILTKKERGRNLLPCTKRGPEKAMRDTQEENAPIGWTHSPPDQLTQ